MIGDVLVAPLWFVFLVLSVFVFSPATSATTLSQTLSYFFWGYTFVLLFNTGLVGIGQFMVSEQTAGTLEQILMAPANRLTLVAGRWATAIVTDSIILSCTALFLVAAEHVAVVPVNPLPLLLVYGLLEVGLLGLGLTFAGITLRFKGITSSLSYVWFGVIIFSGVFFPITSFPRPLIGLSLVLPTTYYVDMIKHFALASSTLLSQDLELGLLGAFSVGFVLLGWYVFGVMDRIVKEQGRVGQY